MQNLSSFHSTGKKELRSLAFIIRLDPPREEDDFINFKREKEQQHSGG